MPASPRPPARGPHPRSLSAPYPSAAAIRAVVPRRPAVLLRRLAKVMEEGLWRRPRRERRELVRFLEGELEMEIDNLKAQLQARQKAIVEIATLRGYLLGTLPAPPRPKDRGKSRRALRPSNADVVVEVLEDLGGVQRAETLVTFVMRRHPSFGGTSFRTQVYQILRNDPRVERVGRGLYRIARG